MTLTTGDIYHPNNWTISTNTWMGSSSTYLHVCYMDENNKERIIKFDQYELDQIFREAKKIEKLKKFAKLSPEIKSLFDDLKIMVGLLHDYEGDAACHK